MSETTTRPPADIVGWKAWYADGETYRSTETEWSDLPDEGVQVIVLYSAAFATEDRSVRYRKLLDGDDYYYHVPGTDRYNSTNEKDEIPEAAIVRRGEEIETEAFREIKQTAVTSSWP